MNSRGLAVFLLLVLFAPLSCAAWAESEIPKVISLSCELGFLQVAYPGGEITSTGFRGSLSFAVGEALYPGYARLLLAKLEATISEFPLFLDLDGDGAAERRLLDNVTVSEADVRWAHGGIRLATGEFLLYVHLHLPELRTQGAVVLEQQYVRLVLHGVLRQGATSLSVNGTGRILAGELAGTALTFRARCSPR
jgi:hypothetical protein